MKIFFWILQTLFILGVLSKEVEIETFQSDPKINSSGFMDFGTLRVTKIKKNEFSISGDLELFVNSGDEKMVVLQIINRDTKQVVIKTSIGVCKFTSEDKLFWPDVLKASNAPKDNPCPFPKGKYSIKNYIVDEVKFSNFPPGKYTARVDFVEDNNVLGAVEINTNIKF